MATSTLAQHYSDLLKTGELSEDDGQASVIAALDELQRQLADYRPKKPGVLGQLFGGTPAKPPRGLYIWGGVGRGKTMLMDIFFQHLPQKSKRRSHFLTFMRDVHARIHRLRQKQRDGKIWEDSDPIELVADELAEISRILCFDEFQVSDISDAMILGRLFSAIFQRGCVVVATSNIEPSLLYKDGLNRSAFEPFIGILKEHMDVIPLDGARDYRLGRLSAAKTYLTPLNEASRKAFHKLWQTVTDAAVEDAQPDILKVNGRELPVPRAARETCMFSFADLCAKPLGAGDYLAIAETYKTLFLHDVPVLTGAMRNEAKRFILLIDVLYDAGARLVVTAAAAAEDLHQLKDHQFEFKRTVSRLNEMQSQSYFET